MHPIQCKCGTLRGQLEGTGVCNRLICYCTDCRAFASFLGRTVEVLDKQGGTEIVQVAQPRLRFLQGEDRLSAVRLSEKGLVVGMRHAATPPSATLWATQQFHSLD
jgi:hypothetical protein